MRFFEKIKFIVDWLINIFTDSSSVAHIVLLYSVVIAAGVLLGKIKVAGISLGVTFVLFAGILAGHLGFSAPLPIINFLQDFGLILFVFMIGLQVGPGFFENFGKEGLKMNGMAALIILLNVAVMFACYFIFFDTSDVSNLPMMVGTLYGAVTNTPGLGAANESLTSIFSSGDIPQIANGYACAYPLGVLGIIGTFLLIKFVCKVNLSKEDAQLELSEGEDPHERPHRMTIRVDNSYIANRTLLQIHEFLNRDFVCSRILHNGSLSIPNRDTVFELGDEILVVCAEADVEPIKAFIGPEVECDWSQINTAQPTVSKSIVVTDSHINGKTLLELHLSRLYGVNVTRVTRQGMEIFARATLPLQVGDHLRIVGPEDAVNHVTKMMGNSERKLNAPNIATIFIGIILGIFLGMLPIALPGIPVPLKLGLAGGPLIVSILIGRWGYKIKLVTYTTNSANFMLRDIGLVLFLASVGIKAGDGFWETVTRGDGLLYVLTGFFITVIPLILVGLYARLRIRLNYYAIIGMIAGSYTDPPALAYANSMCVKDAPSVSYSTVYPLSMFLRIFLAQIIVLFFCG